jgi:hypothetical protein
VTRPGNAQDSFSGILRRSRNDRPVANFLAAE